MVFLIAHLWLLLFIQGALSRPNIVLILADDLGWNDVGHHGSEVPTPNIDALGHYGIFLDRHYSQPTCTPSRTALMTAKYPSRLGMQGAPIAAPQAIGLPLTEKIMPQYFSDIGYDTHLVGKWHLGHYKRAYLPTNRGFSSHFGYWMGYVGHYDGIHYSKEAKMGGMDFRRGESRVWSEIYGNHITSVLTEETVRLIRERKKDKSFLIVLAHSAPHAGNPNNQVESPKTGMFRRTKHIRNSMRRAFADMVYYMDASVGEVVGTLNSEGILNNTIVAFISDNGAPTVDPVWELQNYGSNWPLRGQKCSSHEGGVRTVGTLWVPNLKKRGYHYKSLFHISDWLPTLYAAAGGNLTAPNLDGLSHWSNIQNSGSSPPRETLLVDMDDSGEEAIIHGKWKLIRNFNLNHTMRFSDHFYPSAKGSGDYSDNEVRKSRGGQALSSNAPPQRKSRVRRLLVTRSCTHSTDTNGTDCFDEPCLFDLDQDPCERTNLAGGNPEVVSKLQALLQTYRKQMTPKIRSPIDPNANPTKWGNYWVPWLDDKPI